MASVLEEKDAIRELIAEYCFRIDFAEFDRWADLFTENGVFEVPGMFRHEGRENLLAFAKGIPLNAEGRPGFMHCTLNHIIEVEGDRAKARCYFVLVADGDPLRTNVAGRYEDSVVKKGGRWRFERRTVSFDYKSFPAQ